MDKLIELNEIVSYMSMSQNLMKWAEYFFSRGLFASLTIYWHWFDVNQNILYTRFCVGIEA